jgi:hypothetical protein
LATPSHFPSQVSRAPPDLSPSSYKRSFVRR